MNLKVNGIIKEKPMIVKPLFAKMTYCRIKGLIGMANKTLVIVQILGSPIIQMDQYTKEVEEKEKNMAQDGIISPPMILSPPTKDGTWENTKD